MSNEAAVIDFLSIFAESFFTGMSVRSDSNIAVIGYGSWATAIVKVLCDNGKHVFWHIRNADILDSVREDGVNCKYLSDVVLPKDRITASDDLDGIVSQCDTIFMVMPAAYVKLFLEPLTVSLRGKFIISAIKGTVPEEDISVSEYLNARYGIPYSDMGVVCGPTHAEEVSHSRMTYITAACENEEDARAIGSLLSCRYLKVSYSSGVRGTEYAAVLKNVYAIAAGMASGLGYGDNFLAVLVSSCAWEMKAFMEVADPQDTTLHRNCLGDLLVTCYSNYSRNRRLGSLIGKGCTVKSALNEMTMVAEGYFAAAGIHNISVKLGVSMPIAEMVYNVLYNKANARKEFKALEAVL